MTAERVAAPRRVPKGSPLPRVAPPTPARSLLKDFRALSSSIGLTLFPWQETAGRYICGIGPGGKWLYREVAIIVARQNGKTALLVPHIVSRLLAGRKIMHTAQNRELPREVHAAVAEIMMLQYRDLLRSKPRYANGQEEIRLTNGAIYRIVAPSRGGARGPSNDDVIIDELREMETHDFIAAAKPTLTASANPQMLYLSNAGTDESDVLNALRKRAGEDPALAYLEWSADPELKPDDFAGWRQANPAMGHIPEIQGYLEREYRSNVLADTLAIFETEHLCRWVKSMRPRIVAPAAWEACRSTLEQPHRAVLGISMDMSGTRAAAVSAWQQPDGTVAVRIEADVVGEPIDVERLGRDLRDRSMKLRVSEVVFDPYTDKDLARYFRRARPINGMEYAAASERFARLIDSGKLRWDGAEQIGEELAWTGKREMGRSWMAVRDNPEHPITSVLAAIRAAWVVSEPRFSTATRSIY